MREIKFRAWDKKRKKMIGSDYPGNWGNDKDEWYADVDMMDLLGIENAAKNKNLIIMQFTGLKDKNGKEIYEGDILSFAGNITADDSLGADPNGFIYDETSKHAVVWDEKEGAWFPDTTNAPDNEHWKYRRDTRWLMRDGKCKIIGNLYENPELLKEGI